MLRNVLGFAVLMTGQLWAADAYFEVTDGTKNSVVVRLSTADRIQKARDILAGRETEAVHLQGKIAKAPAFYNPGWFFHVDPNSVSFFSMAMEVCDSSISGIADHLGEVGGALLPNSVWCGWGTRLVREVPEPENASSYLSHFSPADGGGAAFAPGSLVAARGVELSHASVTGRAAQLDGVSVTVTDSTGTDRGAVLSYASPAEVHYVLPEELAAGLAEVKLITAGGAMRAEQIWIESVAPALFREDVALGILLPEQVPTAVFDAATRSFKPNPVAVGNESQLLLYGTGLRGRPSLESLTANFSGALPAVVLEAGPAPGSPGVDQIRIALPSQLAGTGENTLRVSIQVGDRSFDSNWVRLNFR